MKARLMAAIFESEGHVATTAAGTGHDLAERKLAAHRKYKYELSNGRSISYGYTRRDALEVLLAVAAEQGWAVYQPRSRLKALTHSSPEAAASEANDDGRYQAA